MTTREIRQRGFLVISRLFEAISQHGYSNVMYRGHANKSWLLVPSVFRPKEFGIKNASQLKKWIISSQRYVTPRPQSSIEWLVWAQHYGIATALLDWSTSPLIALYFACAEVPHRNGLVIMANRNEFLEWYQLRSVDIFLKGRKRPGLFAASAINARALAQDSVMSLHTANFNNELHHGMRKDIFEIRSSQKSETLLALEALGITKDRVYSDINIMAENFKDSLSE